MPNKIDLSNVEREYLITLVRISAAKHNGADLIRVSEFWPEGSLIQSEEVWRFVRGNKVICPFCEPDLEQAREDTGCMHSAIIKTWKRQGMPVGRVYVSSRNRIGYYGGGEIKTLSTMEQVNRVGEGC